MKKHLTKVNIAWNNASGRAYLDSRQRPYARITVQTQEDGKTWLSGFAYTGEKPLIWKAGDEVDVDIERKPDGKGGEYVNFRIPKATGTGWSPELVEKLFVNISELLEGQRKIFKVLPRPIEPSLDDIKPEDIPF